MSGLTLLRIDVTRYDVLVEEVGVAEEPGQAVYFTSFGLLAKGESATGRVAVCGSPCGHRPALDDVGTEGPVDQQPPPTCR